MATVTPALTSTVTVVSFVIGGPAKLKSQSPVSLFLVLRVGIATYMRWLSQFEGYGRTGWRMTPTLAFAIERVAWTSA